MNSQLSHTFEKFTTSNYQTWKVMVQMILIEKDLWDVVSRDHAKPTDIVSQAEKLDWKRKADKARAIIILSISSSELVYTNNITNLVELWTKLENIYILKTTTLKYFLLQNFYILKYSNSVSTIQEHINKLTSIDQQLINLREVLSESSFIVVLLLSLPESYNNFVNILESQSDLSKDLVIRRLIKEE